jgi:hypothetical protein
MDKSPDFIKMCSLANEIQQQWRQCYGDFFVSSDGRVECWIPKQRANETVKKGFGVCSRNGLIRMTRYTWLPRQDQLIEMAQESGRRYESITQEFFIWAKAAYGPKEEPPSKLFSSMEKIWLAFVMHKNFWKKWHPAEGWQRQIYRRPRQ